MKLVPEVAVSGDATALASAFLGKMLQRAPETPNPPRPKPQDVDSKV
jgi:hypothetical protein